jgi:catechol 1,2-dioxygenase
MTTSIARTERIERFLDRVSGQHSDKGSPRVKQVVRRIVGDLYRTIEDLDVQPEEFWKAISFSRQPSKQVSWA